MNSLIKRLILAGLTILPAACATYSHGYYDTGYSYSPGYYDSGFGYGVVERNYYNSYTYPTPVYRTEEYHHHHRYDGRDRRYPDRHYQDGRRYFPRPGANYRSPDSRDRDPRDHYNWNTRTAKPYDNRYSDRDRQRHESRLESWQHRPADPNAYGQWRRQQNWGRLEARPHNRGFREHPHVHGGDGSGGQNNVPIDQRNGQDGQQREGPSRWRGREQTGAQSSQ